MVSSCKGEQYGFFSQQQGEVFLWRTQIHFLNNIKEATCEGESAAPFDFVYVLEIASHLQLARCSVRACVYVYFNG